VGLFSGRQDTDDGDAGGDESSPWEGRGFIAAAIVVGALVVCALVFIFARGGGQTPTTQPSETPSTSSPTEQPSDQPTRPPATPGDEPTRTPATPTTPAPIIDPAGGCKSKSADQQVPRVAPAAVTWLFEANMLIPLQRRGGPASQDADGLRHCYAHSPTGVVLAAMVTLGQLRNPDLTEAVLQRRTAPGPGRTKALAAAKSTPTPRNDAAQTAQFTGFKILDYLPNRAIISIAVRIDAEKVASLPVTMAWSGGDWKMVLQADGTINGDVAPDLLGSLDGYVSFGGA
jgi:hypothetical protein